MSTPTDAESLKPSTHLLVVDNFLPEAVALAMRRCIDQHFARPNEHTPATHQLWNYWYVPGLYTYLRTEPNKIISGQLLKVLSEGLINWGRANLALDRVSDSYLSMYINGCRQGLHNDSENGRFGWVYSLTSDQRRTTGGETLVLRLDDYGEQLHYAQAGSGLYDLVEPKFNRLVVFDDRVPHAVQPLEGSYEPAHARFVIHGHIRETGPRFQGGISREGAEHVIRTLNELLMPFQSGRAGRWHGPLCLHAKVQADGSVTDVVRLVDRVFTVGGHRDGSRTAVRRALECVQQLQVPNVQGGGEMWLPIQFGPRLPT